jgi:phage shock protein A
MKQELDEARARVESLRRMVDLLVEERSSLQDENARLAEKAALANPEIEEKLANLSAEKALAEAALEDLTSRNVALAETLGESEMERRRLARQLAELAAEQEEPVERPLLEKGRETLTSPDGKGTGTITVFEQPMVIEKPLIMPTSTVNQAPPPSKRDQDRRARYGPRKFR